MKQVKCCEHFAEAGAVLAEGTTIALWLSGTNLPEHFSHAGLRRNVSSYFYSEVDFATFIEYAQPEVVDKVQCGMAKLQHATWGPKKRRRLNNYYKLAID